jgi:predicted phosphoribosyltransferase
VTRFRDFTDAGEQLAPLVREHLTEDAVLIAIAPGGVPVARALHAVLVMQGTQTVPVPQLNIFDGELPVDVSGRHVVVIDDGVETGTAARRIGELLRAAGAESTVFAVPVCPVESRDALRELFDELIAIEQPEVRQPLHLHFERFE